MEYLRLSQRAPGSAWGCSIWVSALLAIATVSAAEPETEAHQLQEIRSLHSDWMSAAALPDSGSKQAKELYATAVASAEAAMGEASPTVLRKLRALKAITEQPIAEFVLQSIASRPPPHSFRPQRCEDAIELDDGFSRSYSVVPGERLWFRLEPGQLTPFELSTLGSTVDSLIQAAPDCDTGVTETLADDNFGLQAIATFHPMDTHGLVAITVANAGELVVKGASNGAVSGRLTGPDTTNGIDGDVNIYTSAGGFVTQGIVSFDGFYSRSLPSGSYRLVAGSRYNHPDGVRYIAEIYDDISCLSVDSQACNPLLEDGVPVEVMDGVTTTGIDFALDRAPRIRGAVVAQSDMSPLRGSVTAVHRTTGEKRTATAEVNGFYAINGLEPGQHDVYASHASYGAQLYSGVDCGASDCGSERSQENGTVLLVSLDQPGLSDIDFSLAKLGKFTGLVTDAETGQPIPSARVEIYDQSGTLVGDGDAGNNGLYVTHGLYDGTYYLVAVADGYQTTVHAGVGCDADCNFPTDGTPIEISGEQTVTVDFSLLPRGRISGLVLERGSDAPLPHALVCFFQASDPRLSFCDHTNADGSYESVLLEGEWYVVGSSGLHQSQLYQGFDCDLEPIRGIGNCLPENGTPIGVAATGNITGVDFRLRPLGRIEVTVKNGSGEAIPDASVSLRSITGSWLPGGHTDDRGVFVTQGLRSGDYTVHVAAAGYASEAYDNALCQGFYDCDDLSPVSVNVESTTAISISLELAPSVTVTLRGTDGSPLDGSFCRDSLPKDWFDCSFFPGGTKQFELQPNTYIFKFASAGYYSWVPGIGDCVDTFFGECDAAGASHYELKPGDSIDVEVSLTPLPRVSGRVSFWSAVDGYHGAYVHVYAENSSDDTVYGYDSARPEFDIILPRGRYKLVASGADRFHPAGYGIGSCGSEENCRNDGVTMIMGKGTVIEDIDLHFLPRVGIYGTLVDAEGNPLPGVLVDFWNLAGAHVASTTTDSLGNYYYDGVEAYFISTNNDLGYQEVIYPSIFCGSGSAFDGSCDPTRGRAVSGAATLTVGANRANIVLGASPPLFVDGFEGN